MTDSDILYRESRSNLAAFVLSQFDDYLMGWFHRELCTTLMKFYLDVKAKKRPRLIITAPPRHGKSQIVSRGFPSWVLGVDPDLNVIASSYNQDLANSMSRDVQAIMKQPEYRKVFPYVNLHERKSRKTKITAAQSAKYFEVPGRKGKYVAAGVGTGITGKGADIAIIDDPFKDQEQADSPTIRKRVWEWYTAVVRTRIAPGGGIIIMHTRWHENDLVGELLTRMASGSGETFHLIDYPAVAEVDEPHRKKGEPLHPERFDLDELGSIRKAVGERVWNALYQQHPAPPEGGIFKKSWFRFYIPGEEPKEWDSQVQSWDLNVKKGEDTDDAAGGVLGRVGARIYLLDVDSKVRNFPETMRAFQIMCHKWPDALAKLIENKANGPALNDMLEENIPGMILVEPQGSKTARANAVAPFVEGGGLYVPDPRYCEWSERFINQMITFPNASHDDMVDMATMGMSYLIKQIPTDNMWT